MTHPLPKITVITPSYNQGRFIEQTIQSVLRQEYPNLEYLVFDGGSTDETVEILKNHTPSLRWVSEKDNGQSNALNKGFRSASGDILAFINTDDIYEPGALLAVGQYFAQHPDVYWLTGRCLSIDQHGNEIRRFITRYKNFWLRFRSLTVLRVLNYISQPATFWRREVFETIGGMREDLHYAMDYDYWLRIGKHFRLSYLDQPLARFRIHPTSKAGASATAQFDAGLRIVRSHVSSPVILALHRLHLALTVRVYRRLLSRERQ